MVDVITETSSLGTVLDETRGVVGVVLGTADGELRAVIGSVLNGDACAAAVAAVTLELAAIGTVVGLGVLGVASVMAPTAARVLARQAGAVLAIELDPKRPLGELETKLRTLAWAPADMHITAVDRTPPPSLRARMAGTTRPPFPGPAATAPARRVTTQTLPRASRSIPVSPLEAAPLPPPPRPPPPRSVGSGPVFAGALEEFCIPDLLQFLRNSQRTGLLLCTTSAGTGTVQLSRGMIISADSPNALGLRQQLLDNPGLAPEQREILAGLPVESFGDDAVDDAIASRNLVPRDDMERARVARIYSAFREMIGWTSGRFSFDPAVPVMANPALALSAQSILMQICQEQDDQVDPAELAR